jgi:GLPGLI family protein
MKRYWLSGLALAAFCNLQGQQQQGRILYERTTQLQITLAGMDEGMARNIPRSRTDKMEVLFGNNQSIRKPVREESPEPANFEEGAVVIRTFGGGADDQVYLHHDEKRIVEQREFAGKKYIIADSIRTLAWKLTGESKTILGFACQQAIAQRIGSRFSASMVNGSMKRIEVADTSNIVAWFTPAIPVPTGPDYQGQLPGAIMEIDINNGRTVYKALEVSEKTDLSAIKEPRSGKKVTASEFADEQQKLMQDMQKNGGRVQTFRMN